MQSTIEVAYSYTSSTARIVAQANVPAGKIAQDQDTGNLYVRTTTGWVLVLVTGAALVTLVDQAGAAITSLGGSTGPATLAQSIPFPALTGFVDYDFPAGSKITFLSVSVTAKNALASGIPDNIAAVLYLDADSTAARDAICGATGDLVAAIPVPGLYQCPVGQITNVSLLSALSNGAYGGGRISVRSLDGQTLNVLVTAG